MELVLKRGPSVKGATIGELFADGLRLCYTLEDEVREVLGQSVATWKIAERTAIPIGRYKIVLTKSLRFGRKMPLLLAVPGFEAIEIHWGNSERDTAGCILVGLSRDLNLIYQSKAAFKVVFALIEAAILRGEEVFITVS